MIYLLQITAFIFALVMIYFAILHNRRGELNGIEFGSWLLIWVTVIFVVIFPDIFRTFAQLVLLTRLFDLLVIGAILLVITMSAISYIKVKRMEEKVEDFIRLESIKNVDEKKSQKK